MKNYTSHNEERIREAGMTDLIVFTNDPTTGFTAGDFTGGFGTIDINLASADLAIGDIILDAMMEVKTAVTGPTGTPTGALSVTGQAAQLTAATSVIATGQVCVGSAFVPYIVTATGIRPILHLLAGGGNGAAATAGEIWCWLKIWRAADRSLAA